MKHPFRCLLTVLGLLAFLPAPAVSGQAARGGTADLRALPEHLRPDPFGGIVTADWGEGTIADLEGIELVGARGGYLSCHLVVRPGGAGSFRLDVESGEARGLEVDLFRQWFHRLSRQGAYYPDALVPVTLPVESRFPDPDTRIDQQQVEAFWLDIWVPPTVAPGVKRLVVRLEAPGGTDELEIRVRVLEAVVPDEDPVVVDHNSYGTAWLAGLYPEIAGREGSAFFAGETFFRLIHQYHRLFFEHRGTFHQLGYGHGGKTGIEFAPRLEGSGRDRRIADWTLYDRHYGPLFDGSAFTGSRRPARPIPFVYLPINPEWPASFVNWGEPGYEVEFVNVVSEMERHFREKGWISTYFEMYFNHKKRYKAFHWDGDETRFEKDLPFFGEYSRMLKRAVPKDSPVRFVFRSDASWLMERQFKEQGGIIDFWVSGGGMFSWYDWAPKLLKGRGDIVWIYGGAPAVVRPLAEMSVNPLRAWLFGIDGYIHWLTTDPGDDPWFDFDGGGTALAYPGERFGVAGPIPCVRLKVQRNIVQDLALLHALERSGASPGIREIVAGRFNGMRVSDWWTPRPPIADRPVLEWTNENTGATDAAAMRSIRNLSPQAWQNVRDYLLEMLGKEGR